MIPVTYVKDIAGDVIIPTGLDADTNKLNGLGMRLLTGAKLNVPLDDWATGVVF
jgi:hypothetical protein